MDYRGVLQVNSIILFIYGLCAGSFANLVAERMITGEEYIFSRSHCDHCGHTLSFTEMIPVLSWLALKGRCRHCRHRISVRHPIMELVCGLVTVLLPQKYQGLMLAGAFAVAYSLMMMATQDILTETVSDRLLLMEAAGAVLFLLGDKNTDLRSVMMGCLVITLPMLLMIKFFKGFGEADLLICLVSGAILGTEKMICAFVLALLPGALAAMILLSGKRAGRKSRLPFVPFLAFGIITSLIYGYQLVGWYLWEVCY